MKRSPALIIIGGGISGLSAGIYGSMNGFETHIFEKSSQPGAFAKAGIEMVTL